MLFDWRKLYLTQIWFTAVTADFEGASLRVDNFEGASLRADNFEGASLRAVNFHTLPCGNRFRGSNPSGSLIL